MNNLNPFLITKRMSQIPFITVTECLEQAVGLTRTKPNCYGGFEEDYTHSRSNLFLDELKGLDLRWVDAVGGETDLWEKMINARKNAAIALKADLSQEITKRLEIARRPFSGDIGSTRFAGSQTSRAFKGMRIYSDVRGASITIRGFHLMLNTTEQVELNVYRVWDKESVELIETYELKSEALKPKYNALAEPLTLDLQSEYYFIYTSVGNALKSKFGCCGYKWRYDCNRPMYSPSRMQWTRWLMAAGTTGDNINQPDRFTTSMYSFGLAIQADTVCDAYGMLCNEGTDFEIDPVAISIAYAMLYKAGEFLLDNVLDTNEMNRYTLLSLESINANREYYAERYVACMEYVASEINHLHNDCWKCRDRATVRGQML